MYLFQHGRVFRVVPSQRPVPAFSKRSISRPGSRLFLGYPVLYTRRFEAGETSIPGVSQVSQKTLPACGTVRCQIWGSGSTPPNMQLPSSQRF